MTMEEYVKSIEHLVPASVVELSKDWSTSDKMYFFLHQIQLKWMNDIISEIHALMRK